MLYPLSYEGNEGGVCAGLCADLAADPRLGVLRVAEAAVGA